MMVSKKLLDTLFVVLYSTKEVLNRSSYLRSAHKCLKAVIGWKNNMRGPENRITSRILALISGL